MRFLDLVEANKQRNHELKMKRRRTTLFMGLVGFVVGFVVTIWQNVRSSHTTFVVED